MPALEQLLVEAGGGARRRDLVSAGVSRRALERAVAVGAVRRLAPHVLCLPLEGHEPQLRAVTSGLQATASHQDAARLWGLDLVDDHVGLHVTVPRSRSRARAAGAVVHRADLAADEVDVMAGVAVTAPLRTVLDLCRSLPVAEAVVVVDSALRSRLVTPEELVGAVLALPRAPGRVRVQRAVVLADPACGSALESLFRVLLVLAGLDPPQTQFPVRHGGRLLGRVDFAWPAHLLVVETDGFAFHSDRTSYRSDRRRTNALTLAGWRVLRFSWEDVVHEPERVVAEVRAALGQAADGGR